MAFTASRANVSTCSSVRGGGVKGRKGEAVMGRGSIAQAQSLGVLKLPF